MEQAFPKVSVIIPAFNEDRYIGECLSSVISLEYPKDKLEIIVVDNGSTDNTNSIARGYPVKLIEKPGVKVGAVRNAGFAESTGEILAFTDADCIVPKQWLEDALVFLFRSGIGAVGGGCLVKENGTWLEKAWVSGQGSETLITKYLPGANFIVSREVFCECGGFDEVLSAGEDDKLSIAITSKGFQLLSLKQCFVIHQGYPKSVLEITKRQIWHSKNSIDITNPLTNKLFIATNVFIICHFIFPLLVYCHAQMFYISCVVVLITCIINIQPLKKVIAWNKQHNDISSAIIKLLQLNIIYYFYFVGRSVGLIFNYYLKIKYVMTGNGA
ncbi:MAG: glycosyltransferase [Desulfuromonadaceae bacterium]|nr:glycosyltransferase [Desulfuromonadaceae bacterium]